MLSQIQCAKSYIGYILYLSFVLGCSNYLTLYMIGSLKVGFLAYGFNFSLSVCPYYRLGKYFKHYYIDLFL